jgi:putative glutamine amidotransferase
VTSDHFRPLIGIPAASVQDGEYLVTPTYRFNGLYAAALAASGADPLVIPLDLPDETLWSIYGRLDGLCLAGGVDVDPAEYGEAPHPKLGHVDAARDRTELALACRALEDDLPVLGICRGIQLLNVAAGGSLVQDIPVQLPDAGKHDYALADSPWERITHTVRVQPGSRLAGVLGATQVPTNSFHHQAVKGPGAGLTPVAWAEDGVVEAVEDASRRFVAGVQWHPEGMFRTDPIARRLFAAFVATCVAPARRNAR